MNCCHFSVGQSSCSRWPLTEEWNWTDTGATDGAVIVSETLRLPYRSRGDAPYLSRRRMSCTIIADNAADVGRQCGQSDDDTFRIAFHLIVRWKMRRAI